MAKVKVDMEIGNPSDSPKVKDESPTPEMEEGEVTTGQEGKPECQMNTEESNDKVPTGLLLETSQDSLGVPKPVVKTEAEMDWEKNIKETPNFQTLLQGNLDESVIFEIFKLIERGAIEFSDVDETVREAVGRFSKVQGVQFMKVLGNKDLSHISRKAPYICAQTKIFSYYIKNKLTIFNGPDQTRIEKLQKQTGYPIKVTEGQRRYGPPPDWEGEEPTHREISVSKIPADWYEDKLVPIFSQYGKIYELRIMIDSVTGLTRHFCFVKYCDAETTEEALHNLDEYELEDGQVLKANFSSGNRKLFVGNIPKTESAESLKLQFTPHVHGLNNVEVFVSEEMGNKGLKNRGFCFMEFLSHSYAAEGKKVIMAQGPKLFNDRVLRVEWADKQYEPTPAECSKVKCVHVSNLASSITEEILQNKFELYGKLYHVQKVRDYAFIHYEYRDDCLRAIEEADGMTLEGLNITCRLSMSGPMLRKIKRQNERAILRGDFGFGKKKERQQPPPPRQRNYSNQRSGGGYRDGGYRDSGYRDGRYRDGGGRDRRDRDHSGGYRDSDRRDRYQGNNQGGGGGRKRYRNDSYRNDSYRNDNYRNDNYRNDNYDDYDDYPRQNKSRRRY